MQVITKIDLNSLSSYNYLLIIEIKSSALVKSCPSRFLKFEE